MPREDSPVQEFPISWQSYQSRAPSYSAQRLVNLYYETAPPTDGTKTSGILFRRPGLTLLAELGNGPIRGIHTMNKVTFIVSGQLAYTLNQAGVATVLAGDPISGTDLVDMDDNGSQVAVAASGNGYIITTSTVTQITDDGFLPVSSVAFQDSFFIWTVKDSAQFFISPSFEGLGPYDPLDRVTAEYAPDILVKVFSDHGDLFLLGTESVEPWRGSGNVDFPYAPLSGAAMEVGTIARDTVQKIDNSIMWFGQDERGGITVWRANGYTPQRVSTHALEAIWDKLDSVTDAYAFTFRTEGHAFYVLTIKNQGTWVYDAATGFWTDWQSEGAKDWTVVGFASSFGRRIVGDRNSGKIYNVDTQNFDDDGTPIIWEVTSPPIATANNSLARHNFVRVDAKMGVGLTGGGDPKIWIMWSDEDGERFNSPKLLSLGKRGETTNRMYIRRLGQARSRTYRLRGSDPVDLALLGAYVEVQGGRY